MRARFASVLILCSTLGAMGCASSPALNIWRLDRIDKIGTHATEVLGTPKPAEEGGRKALCFDGRTDGLIVPVNPIAGWPAFTIEVLFRPDGDGPEEQRFLHIQDEAQRRVLIETRVAPDRTWSLDTFLHASASDRLTLLDRSIAQPADRWYWAALTYDGATMRHYVNAAKQLEGAVRFAPMTVGRVSLGVRQNRIHWFKGCISQVRFTGAALAPRDLQSR